MNQNDESWVEFQKQVMLKDYEIRLQDRARQLERMDVFRQWEITILAAVLSYALAQNTVSSAAYLIGGIIFLFLLLELAARGNLLLMEDERRGIEILISTGQNFSSVLPRYKFIASWLKEIKLSQKIIAPLKCLTVLELWLWHGSLIVLFLILILAIVW